MAYIRQVETDSAEGRLQQVYQSAIERTGHVANVIKIMSLDARVCQASTNMYVAAVRSETALDRATRELLAAVVSNVNDCYY